MSQRLRGALTAAIACVAILALAIPATAHKQTKFDGNDVAGPLDIREASFNHRDGKIIVTQTTRGDWTAAQLEENKVQTDRSFIFQFDSRGTGTQDYFVYVDYINGQLRGLLYRITSGSPVQEGSADVDKNGRTLKAKFRKGRINPRDSHIRWDAESEWTDKATCASGCRDLAPNVPPYVHNL
jgi:hypothetical protein